jgi:hypothetical protein
MRKLALTIALGLTLVACGSAHAAPPATTDPVPHKTRQDLPNYMGPLPTVTTPPGIAAKPKP